MDIDKLSQTLNKPQQGKFPFNPERDVEDHSLPYAKLQLSGKITNDDLAGDITPSKIAFTGLGDIVGTVGGVGDRTTNPNEISIINVYHGSVATAGAAAVNVTWTFAKPFTGQTTYIVLVDGFDNYQGHALTGAPVFYATEAATGAYTYLCARNLDTNATLVIFRAIAIGY